MKRAKVTIPLMLISVLLVSLWVPLLNPTTTSNKMDDGQTPSVELAYEAHDYIYIRNDTDFADQADNETWTGDGSVDYPYIIEGFEITNGQALIYIADTRLHFEIRDCNLTTSATAIILQNVTNGLIENCLMVDSYYGVFFENVTGIDVVGCDIAVDPTFGINGVYMDEAIDCSIENCTIEGATGSDAGIYGVLCEGITLFNNTIFEFDAHGIFFAAFTNVDILNNTVYWNEGTPGPTCGVYLVSGELADIIGNNITENSDNGISIMAADNVTIIENHLMTNYIHGIFVEVSDYCIIQDNWIEGHGEGQIEEELCGVYVVSSEYCEIIGNTFWYNAVNSISLLNADFCYIYGNYLNCTVDHGMYIQTSHNVTIEENEIYNSYGSGGGAPACGILMDSSLNASISHNILGANSENGITVINCGHGKMIGNIIYDSEYYGVYMDYTWFWTLTDNVIYDNGAPGIYLDDFAADTTLSYNDIGWSGEFLVYDSGMRNKWNTSGVGNWFSDYNGTGTYSITGGASSTDYHPSMSLYCGATDPISYEAGTSGNTMSWNSSALNPWKYEVLVDDGLYSTVDWDGENIDAIVDGLPVGVYNVTLVVYHVSGHWLSNSSTLTVTDTTIPTWDVDPTDQYLEFGDALSYDIDASDSSGIDDWWLTGDSGFAIDSSGVVTNTTPLAVGVYELTVNINDTLNNLATADFDVYVTDTVYPAWIQVPTDQVINETQAFAYQLGATDLAGIGGWIVNDTTNFAITPGGLITNATILSSGSYGLNISVWDAHGNVRSHTIKIRVNALPVTTTTTTTSATTTTTTGTDTTTPPPDDPTTMIVVVVGGIGAISVVVVIVIVSKKRGG